MVFRELGKIFLNEIVRTLNQNPRRTQSNCPVSDRRIKRVLVKREKD